MELTYFQLLSSDPVYIPNVGGVISPKLKDISSVGETVYQYYLNILLMDLKTFFTMADRLEDYEKMTDDDKVKISVYDLLVEDAQSTLLLQSALNFFIKENVEYSPKDKAFLVSGNVVIKEQDKMVEKYQLIGVISKENFKEVVSVICKRNNVKINEVDDPSKIKSKKALSILQKIKKGRESKTVKTDKNMDLGNIVSAVANKSKSLNIISIWDLTVYQLWDSFTRLYNNNIYDINAASVSAWGDKENKFDFGGWYKKIEY